MDAFQALADPTRRRIVELLVSGERSAGALAAEFEVSRPAISRHLRVLRESGLVAARGEQQQRIYSLQPARLAEVEQWLAGLRTGIGGFWAQRLDALDTQVRRQRRAAAPGTARGTARAADAGHSAAGDTTHGRRDHHGAAFGRRSRRAAT